MTRWMRPILAYLGVVTLGTWVLVVLENVRQGGNPFGAALDGASGLLGSGLLLPVLAAIVGIPAMVLSIGLLHWFRQTTARARAVAGAVAWSGWGLFVAITLANMSGLVLVPAPVAGDLVVVGISGAAFSLLAFDGHETPRAGIGLILLALLDAACIVLASAWMAGRWGGPV